MHFLVFSSRLPLVVLVLFSCVRFCVVVILLRFVFQLSRRCVVVVVVADWSAERGTRADRLPARRRLECLGW